MAAFPIAPMPTTKKRLNLTLSKDLAFYIEKLALRDDVPQAEKAVELIEKALEMEEDAYFAAIADKRVAETKGWMSHEEFWAKVL